MAAAKPAILHTESSCGWGGQEIRILEESRALIRRGYEVSIACPPESRLFRRAPEWGVDPIGAPIARRSFAALMAIRKLLLQHRAGIVNTHSSTDSWLVAIASRTVLDRPAIVRTRHVSTSVKAGPLSRWLYARVPDHVVTTGELLRSMLIRQTRVPMDRVTSVPTGVDPDRFQPANAHEARRRLGLRPETPLIGILATVRSWKGHRYLLDALALSGLSDWHVAVVGEGPYLGSVRARAQALGIMPRVHFVGQQSNPESWLQAIDIACQPSYANEGVSQAVIQAMMTGRPVIATPVGSTVEAVLDGTTGMLVPPRDAQSLAAALQALAGNPELRMRMGQRAREHALMEFSIDCMGDRMEQVFTSALQRRRMQA